MRVEVGVAHDGWNPEAHVLNEAARCYPSPSATPESASTKSSSTGSSRLSLRATAVRHACTEALASGSRSVASWWAYSAVRSTWRALRGRAAPSRSTYPPRRLLRPIDRLSPHSTQPTPGPASPPVAEGLGGLVARASSLRTVAAGRAGPRLKAPGLSALEGVRILVVDDDARNIFAIKAILEESHAEVTVRRERCRGPRRSGTSPQHRYRADGHHDAGHGRLPDHPCYPSLRAVQVLPSSRSRPRSWPASASAAWMLAPTTTYPSRWTPPSFSPHCDPGCPRHVGLADPVASLGLSANGRRAISKPIGVPAGTWWPRPRRVARSSSWTMTSETSSP